MRSVQRTTYDVLHTAGSAAKGLRAGLTRESAARSAPALRSLLAARATAITGASGLLAWDGPGIDHAPSVLIGSRQVMATGKPLALGPRDLQCADGVECPLRTGVVVPLTSGGVVVGTLVALAPSARAGLLRAADEVARFLDLPTVGTPPGADGISARGNDLAAVPVDMGERTLMVERADVCWIQANGDYVRLHTVRGGSHLVRLPLALFEERWAEHGFVRIHRSHLVALRHVVEMRTVPPGGTVVRVSGEDLTVSRRHTAELKHRLRQL